MKENDVQTYFRRPGNDTHRYWKHPETRPERTPEHPESSEHTRASETDPAFEYAFPEDVPKGTPKSERSSD